MLSFIQKFYENYNSNFEPKIIFKKNVYDKGEIYNNIAKYAEALKSLGIKSGDRVSLVCGKDIKSIYAMFGLMSIYAIPILVDKNLSPDNLVATATEKFCIADNDVSLSELNAINIDKLQEIASLQVGDVEKLSIDIKNKTDNSDNTLFITHTSGTTGRPKKVHYSEKNIDWVCHEYSRIYQFERNDSIAFILPFHYCLGIIPCGLAGLVYGKRILLTSNETTEEITELMVEHKINILTMFPYFYRQMVQLNLEKYDFSNLKICDSGGEILPVAVIEKFTNKSKVIITEGYGQTETCSLTHFLVPDSQGKFRLGSVGKLCTDLDAKLLDDNGKIVGENTVGELYVKGLAVMKGYDDSVATRASIDEQGWFKTGDLFYFDSEGFYYLIARKSDIGTISPLKLKELRELEEKIYAIDGVKEYTFISNLNEMVAIFIVPYNTSVESIILLKNKIEMITSKSTIKVDYTKFVDSLPRTSTGKVKKQIIKEM